MTAQEFDTVRSELQAAKRHLEQASALLRPHIEDAVIYQVWCLLPIGAVERALLYLQQAVKIREKTPHLAAKGGS
jgi:hypothetical protein